MQALAFLDEPTIRGYVRDELTRILEAHDDGEPGWLDARGAAQHLAMSEDGIRAAVKRGSIPFVKTPTGRIRFNRRELDLWARGEHHV